METWLIWKLTCGKIHVTDYSNASRTMLFNIHTLDWDDDILKLLDIPRSVLPKPVSNSEFYEYADRCTSAAPSKSPVQQRPAGRAVRPDLL